MRSALALASVLAALALALTLPAPAAAETGPQPPPQTSMAELENQVMCVVCGTALNISGSPAAQGQREYMQGLIAQGLTEDQIKDRLVEQYGETVLAIPTNRTVWLVPAVAALLGLGAVAFTVARWRRRGRQTGYRNPDDAPLDERPELDPADVARLDRDMAALDR